MGLTLNKFLCFELETGGMVVGLFHLFTASLGIILCIIELIELVGASCIADTNCKFDRNVLIGVYAVVDATCSIWAYLSFKCIEATKRRKHELLRPMTNMLITFTVMAFLIFILCVSCQGVHITSFGWGALLFGTLNLYTATVINSLYKKFKEEYNMHRSRVDIDDYPLLVDIDVDMDVDSAITYENGIN